MKIFGWGSAIVTSRIALLLVSAGALFSQGPFDIGAIAARAQANLNRQILAANAGVRQAAAEIPKITDPAAQPTVQPPVKITPVPVATKEQRDELIKLIASFANGAEGSQKRYSMAATAILFAGCGFALLASILSFIKVNTAAGIVGLIVAALTALPSAYPVNGLASFYRTLAAQSTALLYDCSLRDPMSMDAFNSASGQLQLLVVYRGEKFPQLGSVADVSGELVKELQTLKVVNSPATIAAQKP